jgi:hypothetical protein
LALREVDDAHVVPLLGKEAHGPPRAEFYVVGVGGEGEDVEGGHGRWVLRKLQVEEKTAGGGRFVLRISYCVMREE